MNHVAQSGIGRLIIIVLVGLVGLGGCSLPGTDSNGLIPQTGQQAQDDYPAPNLTLDSILATMGGDASSLELTATPAAMDALDLATATPNSLTANPPSFGPADTATTESAATLPPALATFTPEQGTITQTPSPSQTPSPTVSASATATTPTVTVTTVDVTATAPTLAPPAPAVEPTQGPARASLLGSEQFFSQLADGKVRNLSEGEIGEVRGMIFNSLDGHPLYALVAPGHWRGWMPGGGQVPVPWGALNLAGQGFYQPQAGILLLPVADHVLSSAPTIDNDLWDGQNPPADWAVGIDDYWANFVPIVPVSGPDGQPAASEAGSAAAGAPLLLEEGMLNGRGIDVTSSEGETIGRVKDLVIDANGNARYAVVLVDDFYGLGGRLSPVPWSRLVWSPGGWFILQGSPALLQAAPGFAIRANFPDLSQAGWDREIRGYWGE